MKKSSFALEINLTKNCNFACTYCSESGHFENKNFDMKHLPALKEFLLAMQQQPFFDDHYEGFEIYLWGGEPTLELDNNLQIIEYLKDLPVKYFLYTNGSNVHAIKSIHQALNNNNKTFAVQVSYDGIGSHDHTRLSKNGKGTANIVRNNIIELAKDQKLNVNLKATIDAYHFKYLYENFLDYVKLSEETNRFFLYSPTIDYLSDYRFLQDADLKRHLMSDLRNNLQSILEYTLQSSKVNMFKPFENSKSLCSAGAHLFTLNIDGSLYKCHGAIYSENAAQHCLGNIREIDKTIAKLKADRNGHLKAMQERELPQVCKDCFATYCLKCNVAKFDNSTKEDYFGRWSDFDDQPVLCEFYKEISKYAIALQKLKKG